MDRLWKIVFGVGTLIVALWLLALCAVPYAKAQDDLIPIPSNAFPTPAEEADIQRWIPIQCCRTNRCCFKVPASALTPLSKNEWIVNATGQVRERTGWSQDGKVWRCACDLMEGKWVVHLKANTRCIFPAITAARR